MTRVVVTGASGFIGGALCRSLTAAGYAVIGAVRAPDRMAREATYAQTVVGDIDGATQWFRCLKDVDVVVHLAAQGQGASERASDAEAVLQRVNVQGTDNLGRQA